MDKDRSTDTHGKAMAGRESSFKPQWILWDALFTALSMGMAILLLHELNFPPEGAWREALGVWVIWAPITLVLNAMFGCYRFQWSYVSVLEAIRLILSGLGLALVLLTLKYTGLVDYSGSVLLTYIIFTTLLEGFARFAKRGYYAARKTVGFYATGQKPMRVLIIARPDTATLVARRLLQGQQMKFRPVAVMTYDDDAPRTIFNMRVIDAKTQDIRRVLRDNSVDEVVLEADYCPVRELSILKNACSQMQVSIKIYQALQEFEKMGRNPFRELNIEDLIGRSEIKLDRDSIDAFIAGKVVLVTGGAGSIGSEICRQALENGCRKLYILDIHENGLFALEQELLLKYGRDMFRPVVASIRDEERLFRVLNTYKPDVVFHAAAHKHVPMMEMNPGEAIKNNIFGTLNVINSCERAEVKRLIVISTDKAVNPANIMGATKRVTEMLVQVMGRRTKVEMAAVRFGNVMGSNGSVIPLFQKQIAAGGPVTVTHRDVERYFMTIPEAVQLVLQAGAQACQGEIFVFDMGRMVRIYDIAQEMIRLAGFEPDADIKIDIVGLRPGEKLFEELRLDHENMDKTKHDKIFVCHPMDIDKDWLDTNLNYLFKSLASDNEKEVIATLFKMVPSLYRKPEVSLFEKK